MIALIQNYIADERKKLYSSALREIELGIFEKYIETRAWTLHGYKYRIGNGASIEQSFINLCKQVPISEAESLRAEAAKLIDRAKKLEGQ